MPFLPWLWRPTDVSLSAFSSAGWLAALSSAGWLAVLSSAGWLACLLAALSSDGWLACLLACLLRSLLLAGWRDTPAQAYQRPLSSASPPSSRERKERILFGRIRETLGKLGQGF